jgi:hypothetical protein
VSGPLGLGLFLLIFSSFMFFKFKDVGLQPLAFSPALTSAVLGLTDSKDFNPNRFFHCQAHVLI